MPKSIGIDDIILFIKYRIIIPKTS